MTGVQPRRPGPHVEAQSTAASRAWPPAARRRKVRLADIAGTPFIAFERDTPTRKTIDRILRRHHVGVEVAMEFDNIETIKRSVEVGSGLSILPETTLVNEVRSGLLGTRDFVEGPFQS